MGPESQAGWQLQAGRLMEAFRTEEELGRSGWGVGFPERPSVALGETSSSVPNRRYKFRKGLVRSHSSEEALDPLT